MTRTGSRGKYLLDGSTFHVNSAGCALRVRKLLTVQVACTCVFPLGFSSVFVRVGISWALPEFLQQEQNKSACLCNFDSRGRGLRSNKSAVTKFTKQWWLAESSSLLVHERPKWPKAGTKSPSVGIYHWVCAGLHNKNLGRD